jgi:hypothetical protein
MGGRSGGTEMRDTEQAVVFNAHFRKQNDSNCKILQHAATLYNTLQYTTTHCNILHTPQHAAIDTATYCNMFKLQETSPHGSCSFTATCCDTLQRTASNKPTSRTRPERGSYLLIPKCQTLNETCHVWMIHVTSEWVMSRVIAHNWVEAPSWKLHTTMLMNHVTYGWVVSHTNAHEWMEAACWNSQTALWMSVIT